MKIVKFLIVISCAIFGCDSSAKGSSSGGGRSSGGGYRSSSSSYRSSTSSYKSSSSSSGSTSKSLKPVNNEKKPTTSKQEEPKKTLKQETTAPVVHVHQEQGFGSMVAASLLGNITGNMIAHSLLHKNNKDEDRHDEHQSAPSQEETEKQGHEFFNFLYAKMDHDVSIPNLQSLFKSEEYREGGSKFSLLQIILAAFLGQNPDQEKFSEALAQIKNDAKKA